MPEPKEDLQVLLHKARDGCSESARLLVGMMTPQLLPLIRRRLHPQLRRLFDAADLLQEAFLIAFQKLELEGRFTDPGQFRGLLRQAARFKLAQTHRRHLDAQKRDERRALSLDEAGPDGLADRALGPAEEAEYRERLAG